MQLHKPYEPGIHEAYRVYFQRIGLVLCECSSCGYVHAYVCSPNKLIMSLAAM